MSNLSPTLQKQLLVVFLLTTLLVSVIGCGLQASPHQGQADAPTPSTTNNADVPEADNIASESEPPPTPTLDATLALEPIKLTLWTLKDVSVLAEEEEVSDFLALAIQTFERQNPTIEVDVLVKKASGKGGVLDFLHTAKDVAPSVMPDIVVMNATDLDLAYADGLVQSLDDRLDRQIVQDLLPAARRVGTVDGNLVGVPLGIEMEHTVYNIGVFAQTPITWTQILSQNTRYLFPANGINGLVNDATLAQYFSAGGDLLNEEDRPRIDEQALGSVLEFYQNAREQGAVNEDLLDASNTEELWPAYLAGKAGLAQLSVSQYLADRDQLNNSLVTGIPVLSETNTQVSVMHAEVLALVSTDANQQEAALQLMEALLSTENNATWNEIKKSIPARDTAYQQLAGDDPYWQFLTGLLNNAEPEPRFPNYDRVGRILQQAVEQVISGESTAAEATNTAIDALGQ